MKNVKKFFALLLAAAMLFSLAACGKEETGPEATPTPEFVYAAEFNKLPGTYSAGEANFYVRFMDDEGFVGTISEKVGEREPYEDEVYEWEGQFDIYEPRLYRMDLNGRMTKLDYEPIKPESPRADAVVSSILSGLVKTDDGFLVLEEIYASWNDAPAGVAMYSDEWYQYYQYEDEYYVRRLDKQGRELSRAQLDLSYVQSEEGYFNPSRFAVLPDGVILTTGETALYAFNVESGSYLYRIDSDFEWIMNLMQTDDGEIYLLGYGRDPKGNYNPSICSVDAKNRSFGEAMEADGDLYNAIPGSGKYLLYYTSGINFYGYDMEKKEAVKLFNWINVDVIPEDELEYYTVMPDGSVLGLMKEWDKNNENASFTLVSIREVPSSTVPEKTVLTLATDGLDWSIRRELVRFNRASETTRIEVLDYSEYDNYETDYDENGNGENGGMTKLRTEILSGKMPDILDLSGMPTRQLAAKGLLMDLYPLLDADPSLSRSDIFPNFLKAMEVDGKLISISSGFDIQTCVGAKRAVGDTPGWNYEQLMQTLATMPEGCTVFGVSTTRAEILQTVLELDMGRFVDWETGKVSFDSKEFVDLLNFVKSFPAEFDWENYEWSQEDSDYTRVRQGQQLLLNGYLSGLSDLANYETVFGGPDSFTFVGYPTAEGVGNLLRGVSGYAISRDCKDPQAAWQFLRILLTEEYEEEWGYYFPANRNLFEKQKKDAMTITYAKDENGNIRIDPETGEKVMEPKGWSYDPETYEENPIYAFTAEQVAAIERLIAETDRVPDSNKALVDIVNEQAQAFFAGQRTAEDVAKLVQSKANIYVNEQR